MLLLTKQNILVSQIDKNIKVFQRPTVIVLHSLMSRISQELQEFTENLVGETFNRVYKVMYKGNRMAVIVVYLQLHLQLPLHMENTHLLSN